MRAALDLCPYLTLERHRRRGVSEVTAAPGFTDLGKAGPVILAVTCSNTTSLLGVTGGVPALLFHAAPWKGATRFATRTAAWPRSAPNRCADVHTTATPSARRRPQTQKAARHEGGPSSYGPGTPRLDNSASRVLQTNWRTTVSNHLVATATTFVVALGIGRLCARPTIARLRSRLAYANWWLRHDPLTALLNRTGLIEAHTALRQSQYLTLVLVDLDRFKAVNDVYGHDVGDEMLIIAADRIHAAADRHGGITARLAGDEFVVLLPVRDDGPDRPVERILTLVAAPATVHVDPAALTLTVTASAGVCRAEPTDDLDMLLRCADQAMYHAKHAGGNRHVDYQPGMAMPSPTPRRGPRLRDRRDPGQVQP